MKILTSICLSILLTTCAIASVEFYPFDNADPQADFARIKTMDIKSLSPEELTRLGWYYHVYENDNAKAFELFEEAILKSPDEVWALHGMTALSKSEADFRTQSRYVLMLCSAVTEHPLAEIAYNNLRQLIGAVDGVKKPAQELLENQINGNKIKDPFALNLAVNALSAIYALNGDDKSFFNINRRLGFIRDWRIAGPFGQYENLSFFTTLPPENEPYLADKYTFENEDVLTKTFKSDSGRLDAHFMESGVYFAETFIRAKEPVKAILLISSGKSISCSLNGIKCYEKNLIRQYGGATEAVSIQLQKGWNRLAVKLISYPGANIFIELLADDGTVPDVEVVPETKKYEIAQELVYEKIQSAGAKYFAERMESNPKDAVAPLLLGLCNSLTGNTEQTKANFYRAIETAPDYAYANYLLAQILERDGTQPSDIARSEAKKYYESAIKLAGEYPSALSALASHKADEKLESEAIELLQKVINQSPNYYLWHKKLYDLYTAKGWEKERFAELQTISSVLKESSVPPALQRDYFSSCRMFNEYREAVIALQNSSIRGKFLAQHYKAIGDFKNAIKEYEKLKKYYPYDAEIYSSLADIYESQGKTGSAQKQIEKLNSFYPKDVSIMLRLAQLYSLGNNRKKADQTYRAVLERDPLNVTAQRALEFSGEGDFFEKYSIDAWQYVNDPSLREKYKDLSAVIVIDQTVERIFPNGSSQSLIHEVTLVNTKRGIEQESEVEVPQNSEFLQLRTIKKDGTIIEPEIVPGKNAVSMTGTAEGDLIEKKYIVRSPSAFGNRKAYLGQRFYFRTQNKPMVVSQYIVAVPSDIAIQFELLNMNDQPETWTENGMNFYKWERRDIPEIKPEQFSVADYEYAPNVQGGFNIDEEIQSKIVVNNNIIAVKASREVILKAKELADGKASQAEKIRAIYDYIISEIDGGGGNPTLSGNAGFILANKNGDRLCLMKTMLDTLGIPSNIVMAMNITVKKSELFPGFYSYSLLMIKPDSSSDPLFLDLNTRYNAFGFIPPQYQGAEARVLADFPANSAVILSPEDWNKLSTTITTPVLPRESNISAVDVEIIVGRNGSITGKLIDSYNGIYAASLRSNLEQIEEFNLRNSLERGLNSNFRGAKLDKYEITAIKDTDKPLGIVYDFTAANYATASNGMLTFAQGFYRLNLAKTYIRIPKRETPMALYQANNYEHKITVKLPEGSTVAEMPQTFSLDNKYGTYTLETKADGNTFTLVRKFYMPIQKVAPEDYQGFIDFCHAIDKVEEKDLKVTLAKEPEELKEEEVAPPEEKEETEPENSENTPEED